MSRHDLKISGVNCSVAYAEQSKVPIAVGFDHNPGFVQFVFFAGYWYAGIGVDRFTFKLKGVKASDPGTVHFVHFLN